MDFETLAAAKRYADRAGNYSTEEHVIGTWADGKPLYRKSFMATIVAVSAEWQTIATVTDLNIDVATALYGMVGVYPIGLWRATTAYIAAAIDNGVLAIVNNTVHTKACVTLEYTKTTDTAASVSDDTVA